MYSSIENSVLIFQIVFTVLAICCPPVHPSVTSRSCTKAAKQPRITYTMPHDSPGTLVFDAEALSEIPATSPSAGAPYRGGVG